MYGITAVFMDGTVVVARAMTAAIAWETAMVVSHDSSVATVFVRVETEVVQ